MNAPVQFGQRCVGPGYPVLVIAEAGVNHNGELASALQLIDSASTTGVDAIKFQTFVAAKMAVPGAPNARYQSRQAGISGSQLEMLHSLELSRDAHLALRTRAAERGVMFLSTPFDVESADFLDALGVPAFKIGSGELTNWPLLRHVARKGKPVVLSTGMSYLSEVDEAVRQLSESGCEQLVLLHCVSDYPADPRDANLRSIQTLAQAFQVPIGYSDHSLGNETALGAVALGACVVEKHLTLDKTQQGPDHSASMEPSELRALVASIRKLELALGDGRKRVNGSEMDTRRVARRSLAAGRELPAGTVLEPEMLAILRPGTGLPPPLLDAVVGRTLKRSLRCFELLNWTDLA